MAVYTVHQPPRRALRSVAEPERFVFVRDGFSFWAFLLGPLWMLRHRMWLVLVCYVAVAVILAAALQVVRGSAGAQVGIAALLALLVGFEAGTLRRFTLGRRGWTQVGLVAGDGLELAERRFFDAWVESSAAARPAAPMPPAASTIRMPPGASDVVGLFPEPGASA
jgi:uncharacterized protein DUF2628